jgi:hypothetical protein
MSLRYIKEAMYQFSDLYFPRKWSNSWVLSEHHPRSLRGRWWFLRGVLAVFDVINIKEATYQFSDLYLPGKWSNTRILQRVIQGV